MSWELGGHSSHDALFGLSFEGGSLYNEWREINREIRLIIVKKTLGGLCVERVVDCRDRKRTLDEK